jgi:two-component system response regulator ChvI
MARLEALSRRYAAEPTESDESVLRVGELELDPMKFTFSVGGTPVSLTKTQYRMMARMMRHPGNVFSRVMLQKDQRNPGMKVWDERSIDSEIKRIRKKIKDSNGDTDHIEALYGVGYRVRDPRKPLASGADLSWQHLDKVEEVAQLIRVRERV